MSSRQSPLHKESQQQETLKMKGGDLEFELHTPIPNNFKKQAWIFNLGSTGIPINQSHARNIGQHTLVAQGESDQDVII